MRREEVYRGRLYQTQVYQLPDDRRYDGVSLYYIIEGPADLDGYEILSCTKFKENSNLLVVTQTREWMGKSTKHMWQVYANDEVLAKLKEHRWRQLEVFQ